MQKAGKNLLMLLVSLSVFAVSGCASVPNVPLCVEIIPDVEGFCKNTVDAKETTVDNQSQLLNGKTWTEVKTSSLLVPAESWAEIKSYILKQCKKNKDCADHIGDWQNRILDFQQRIN